MIFHVGFENKHVCHFSVVLVTISSSPSTKHFNSFQWFVWMVQFSCVVYQCNRKGIPQRLNYSTITYFSVFPVLLLGNGPTWSRVHVWDWDLAQGFTEIGFVPLHTGHVLTTSLRSPDQKHLSPLPYLTLPCVSCVQGVTIVRWHIFLQTVWNNRLFLPFHHTHPKVHWDGLHSFGGEWIIYTYTELYNLTGTLHQFSLCLLNCNAVRLAKRKLVRNNFCYQWLGS